MTRLNMESSKRKERILSRIRKALVHPVPQPYPKQEVDGAFLPEPSDDLSVLFASEFSRLLGRFAYCADMAELTGQLAELIRERDWKKVYCRDEALLERFRAVGCTLPLTDDLAGCDASVTGCEALVARTGTIVLSSAQPQGRTSSVYAPVHVCIATTSQLVYDIHDALAGVRRSYDGRMPSLLTFATGPSRTADIEKTLVVGVHGPREVFCFLAED